MSKKLLDNFYTEIKSEAVSNENMFETIVELNPNHEIYNGHFPEVPVAPGVTLTQLIQNIVSNKLRKKLLLREANNIKFLAMVNPKIENRLKISGSITVNEKMIDTNATISGKEITYVKFKGFFEAVE